MPAMETTYAVIDLFAGPGGLAEGFSSVISQEDKRPFEIALSVEKDSAAHSTLLLRSFLRQFYGEYPKEYYDFLNNEKTEPKWDELYPKEWKAALQEARKLTLGESASDEELIKVIAAIRAQHGNNTLLIGGPPCQAYSLVGRARNRGIAEYVAKNDPRHYLYKSYIQILAQLRPAAFVMENVKGMLSAKIEGVSIFSKILDDLENAAGPSSYRLVALNCPRERGEKRSVQKSPTDFVIRSEDFGIPQARHRVFVVGIRADLANKLDEINFEDFALPRQCEAAVVSNVLQNMPVLRSGLSRGLDSQKAWEKEVKAATKALLEIVPSLPDAQAAVFRKIVAEIASPSKKQGHPVARKASKPNGIGEKCPRKLAEWILDSKLQIVPNNETRSHIPADLGRYLFSSVYAQATGVSPKAADFPISLAPLHKNWDSGKFADRFRVQVADSHSTTVTSHISKDGHYFIHPDPAQCRSLTVREAARLQTFPDNYYFKGNRTEQFVQVGNAVPPFLAKQIGEHLYNMLRSANDAPSLGDLKIPPDTSAWRVFEEASVK